MRISRYANFPYFIDSERNRVAMRSSWGNTGRPTPSTAIEKTDSITLSANLVQTPRMLNISKDIHSLSDFKRNTSEFLEQMRGSGHPLVLTINGKAELVVQDAASYQKLLDRLDEIEALEGIRRGLADVE